MVIADMGSVRPGVPTLTVALRGTAQVTVQVHTLNGAKHSGQFGGAAPDALIVLMRALATLHDDNGDVAVAGLERQEWTGESYSEDEFRELAEVLPGLPLQGAGGLGSRVWSGPAITVTGIDVPSAAGAVNAVSPYARAKLNLREDAAEAQAALVRHLEALRPFGVALEVHADETGNGFAADTTGRAYTAARAAWGRPTVKAAARSRWSARCRLPRRARRSCSWGPPTATRTSTPPTSASCSTSSRRRSRPRPRWPRVDGHRDPARRGAGACSTASSAPATRCRTRRSCSCGCASA
jgi:acetylornithine deacetylase/succinyl-diaminopimelate desuccinylase-like protein